MNGREQRGWPVVGIGAVASVGVGAEEFFENLCAGRSGLAPMAGFDRGWYTAGQLYEIGDRGPEGDVPGRATRFLLAAIAQAAADAGLGEDLADVPILVGTGLRELRSVELWWRDGAERGGWDLHFGTALRERFGATVTYTFANACAASLYALALATDLLEAGTADTVIVAGTDAITESMFGMADRVQSVPPDTVRPFDRNRRGTILGDGASAVVLRRHAGVGSRVHGRIRGVGVNCDAHHATAPHAGRVAEAIRLAHRRAGVTPAEIDLVLLHGTGTPANDLAEATAIGETFGADAGRPVMTAIKSMTGHTSGASGLHSLITALRAFAERRVPPTTGLDEPLPEAAELRIVRGGSLSVGEPLELAQVNAFGFGGINAVAIVEAER